MALSVLNNLSAIYAANNLDKTSDSLQKVLEQLSSGSRLSSGADDAAGLSLVNGLEANSAALAQSATNATEGVGMLKVADGALSQVTNLLNRAITLATEAANGTLNAAQADAANQEYQSVLSEITNIGSTTTYDQNEVFTGSTYGVAIYAGDSSANGASINTIFLARLDAASLGDAGGAIVQSNTGRFIDLSVDNAVTPPTLATAATTADALTGGITLTVTSAGGSAATYTTTTSTVGALIAEINGMQLPGVTAGFTTAAAVGDGAVAQGDTGIQITNTNANVFISLSSLDDTTTSVTPTALTANNKAITTISYQFAAGGDSSANLVGTGLTTMADAQLALNAINTAVAVVAAQDGYIGAQINTLDSISQIVTSQQENIVSAQNAIQATDYAAATSAMSKYEILNQTGISALAQANSVEQEVTKLLQ